MYSCPGGVKRPVQDRLGTNVPTTPWPPRAPPILDRAAPFKRQCYDRSKWTYILKEVNDHVIKNAASKDMTAKNPQKDVHMSTRNAFDCLKKTSEIPLTSENICPEKKDGAVRNVSSIKTPAEARKHSPKMPAVQSAAASSSEEKKHIVFQEELNVATFLQRLGLSKCLICFKAEEVDMFVLKHMNEDDLKSIGLPMGPRKKIILALASAKTQK